LNSANAGRSSELLGVGGGKVCIDDLIHPLRWGGLVSFLLVDPICRAPKFLVDPLGGPSMAVRKELELGARSRLLALEGG